MPVRSSLTIPKSISKINSRAFYGCTRLKDVYYGGNAEAWDEIIIETGNDPLTRATIHCTSGPNDYYINLT